MPLLLGVLPDQVWVSLEEVPPRVQHRFLRARLEFFRTITCRPDVICNEADAEQEKKANDDLELVLLPQSLRFAIPAYLSIQARHGAAVAQAGLVEQITGRILRSLLVRRSPLCIRIPSRLVVAHVFEDCAHVDVQGLLVDRAVAAGGAPISYGNSELHLVMLVAFDADYDARAAFLSLFL